MNTLIPFAHRGNLGLDRPRGFCLCGTLSPSRRQIRSTRSLRERYVEDRWRGREVSSSWL